MEILRGATVAKALTESLKEQVEKMEGAKPKLAIIRVGERADDVSYERGALSRMDKIGMDCEVFVYPEDITNDAFQKAFDEINENPEIDGILMLRPLPKHLDEKAVENRIDPRKDLDGISPINLAKVFAGDESGYGPCTAEAVMEILEYAGIDLTGKKTAVIGRSLVIGKPVAMMLMKKNATVTICHTRTVDTKEICRNSEIIVAAAGAAGMVDASYVSDGAVVIDVGINVDEAGNLCGDVALDTITNASLATPVPGGVGSVTTSILAKHLMKAAQNR